MQGRRYILTISCPDRVGIVAAVAGFLAEHNGWIIEASHHSDQTSNRFFMRHEILAQSLPFDLAEFRARFTPIAQQFQMDWNIHDTDARNRLMVFVSKLDHCLVDLFHRWKIGELDVEVAGVVSNHDDFRAFVEWHKVPFHLVPVTPATREEAFRKMDALCRDARTDTVVLARYMQILPGWFCEGRQGRIINIHHSFLPSFIGAKPYHQAFERGVKLIGATCHYVTADLDAGPIIEQDVIRVDHGDTIEDIVRLGRDVEKVALSRGLRFHVQDRVLVHRNKTIVFKYERLPAVPLRLLKFGLSSHYSEPRMFRTPEKMKDSYDLVIIGAGGHGLAAAHHLSRDYGMTDIAVLDKGYIGGGNTGRNTAIVRSNYLTPDGVNFYKESTRLFSELSQDLDLNLFYSERGHFTLAHSDASLRTMRWRAEVKKHLGVNSEVITPEEILKLCPHMDISCSGSATPVVGALYHPPGAICRHDAVAWGYAKQACGRGVEIFQKTAVTGIDVKDGQVVGVQTDKGYIKTGRVLSAVAGYTPRITKMVGIRTPLVIQPLQACVTEPLKPWLNQIVVSASLHIYVSQSSRGELVMGASLDPYELHSERSTLDFVEGLVGHIMELFPFLGGIKVMRQWSGMSDMTPDYSPIMGITPVKGFYLDTGWGTWGFKATPVCGTTMAYTVAKNENHPLIKPFNLSRFEEYALVGEKGAASVGH